MGQIELRQTDDEWVVTTPGARLVLRRQEERWIHAFEVRRDGGWLPCAASVESVEGRDELAVVSPTYQEVQVGTTNREDWLSLMLVGAFGPHHFAATVTVGAHSLGAIDHAGFLFDVVDRCRKKLSRLAATYSLSLPIPRTADEEWLSWGLPTGPGGDASLHACKTEPGGVLTCRLVSGQEGVSPLIARVEAPSGPLPSGQLSHRFVYSWSFSTMRE